MRYVVTLLAAMSLAAGIAAAGEYNPVRTHPISIGPEAHRIIVGFRADAGNMRMQMVSRRAQTQNVRVVQANTTAADVTHLVGRAKLAIAKSRQLTPSMHVLYLNKTLYGIDVKTTLDALRADPAVEFAEVDQPRYVASVPNDPLFVASSEATGQWYMQTPSSTTGDLSATDAVSAWSITTGATGTVIADVDTGVRFDHPDLLRAGFGGRLLPGYDFVDQDYSPTTEKALGTFLLANDGDGWDPDPSDPGDWVDSTDQQNPLFPIKDCPVEDSTWHGTRVVGILGALTNNGVGIAGMTWGPLILPVRALGKCHGYDSDIIAGIEWAAGMSVASDVPDNPYPADIINLSLGAPGACPDSYRKALSTVTAMGVLVVISAGNQSGSVSAPANCSAVVAGVIAVAGVRNVGTKVGYSSFGAEVGISAPAGNCIGNSGPCMRSIDTTTNSGLKTPGTNTYTNQINPNLGTSFSAPIVSGVAALMRAVNGNLTPAQLVERLEASATAFPPSTQSLPVCPALDAQTSECSCPPFGECGTGMVNALGAVNEAERPIAAVDFPATFAAGSPISVDASGSAAACDRTIASYAWSAGPGLAINSGARTAVVSVSGTGTLTLTVTDSAGAIDTATVDVGASGASSNAATAAGAGACVKTLSVQIASPTVALSFAPSSVATGASSTLTIALSNTNAFDLTQANLTDTLPSGLTVAISSAASDCSGAEGSLTTTTSAASLAGAIIPAHGSCNVTLTVSSDTAGSYSNTVAVQALSTGPAGGNTASTSASLTVTAPSVKVAAPGMTVTSSASSGSGGGGSLQWLDLMAAAALLWAGRRRGKRAVADVGRGWS